MTSEATTNAISSPGSASGLTPCGAQAGPIASQSGQVPARASLSARQAKAQGLLTSGISGQLGTISSKSAALQSSLASRLQAKTALVGSTLYNLTWKHRATPSGRSIYALRASVRRISGSASGSSESGWPTPTTRDYKGQSGAGRQEKKGNPSDTLPNAAATAQLTTIGGGADWLSCRDGKCRPVEPGTFPLAHGAASRVGRLRAYGNAIVAQAAEEVIAAYMADEASDLI